MEISLNSKRIVENGIVIHKYDDKANLSVIGGGTSSCCRISYKQKSKGAKVFTLDEEEQRKASEYGYLSIVEYLVNNGAK